MIPLSLLRPDIIPKRILHIHKPHIPALTNLIHRLKVLITKLDQLRITLNPLRIAALRQHGVSATNTPGNQQLREREPVAMRNSKELLIRADLLIGPGNLVLRAKRRVGDGCDVVRDAVVEELGVRQEGVDLDLVRDGRDLGEGEKLVNVFGGEVGHADGARLAVADELLHRAPGGRRVACEVVVDDVLRGISGA